MSKKRDRSTPLEDYDLKLHGTFFIIISITTLAVWMTLFGLAFSLLFTNNLANLEAIRYHSSGSIGSILQLFGIVIISIGLIAACWARILRGLNSPSWGLNETIPLVTNGPFRFIRHPSYTFYFALFLGLPLVTEIWLLFFLLFGIYGYYKISKIEEELLTNHFKEKYHNYQSTTKRFIPFIW